MSNGMKMT